MSKLTCKLEPRQTGLAGIAAHRTALIKRNGRQVGLMHGPGPRKDDWSIRLMVKREPTDKDPAPFHWVTLIVRFADYDDAKAFVQSNSTTMQEKFDLHELETD